MKQALGLFLFCFSINVFAESMLILRGRVPASYKVELDLQKTRLEGKHWKVVSNEKKAHGGPRLTVRLQENYYLVSLTHP